MMIPKNREISGTGVLYIVVVNHGWLTVGAHPRRLRRASDAGGVGCSAWLDIAAGCRAYSH